MAYGQHHHVGRDKTLRGAHAPDFASGEIDIRHHHPVAHLAAKFLNAPAKRLNHRWQAVAAQMRTLFVKD